MKTDQLKGPLPRVAAIHDISGFGKCSLTVVLPILSAAGIETCCMPTAVLSTHTGDFDGFTYRDLTDDLEPFSNHWKSLNLNFQSIYTGFLGSPEQATIISHFIDQFNSKDTLVCVDPAMADSGKLYSVFDNSMIDAMLSLCQKSDLIIPNMTEAAFLLGHTYTPGPYNPEQIEQILLSLSNLGPRQVVLTGVYFSCEQQGAACYDSETGKINYAFAPSMPGRFHGTGDVFGSFLVAALMHHYSLAEATQYAVSLTSSSIQRTMQRKTPLRDGVDFEGVLPEMMHLFNLV